MLDIIFSIGNFILLIILVLLFIVICIGIYTNHKTKKIYKSLKSRTEEANLSFQQATEPLQFKFFIQKYSRIENGISINHYMLDDAEKIYPPFFVQHCPTLDELFYDPMVENYIVCDAVIDYLVCDNIEIKTLQDLHHALGLDDKTAFIPKEVLRLNTQITTQEFSRLLDKCTFDLMHSAALYCNGHLIWQNSTPQPNAKLHFQKFVDSIVLFQKYSIGQNISPILFDIYQAKMV